MCTRRLKGVYKVFVGFCKVDIPCRRHRAWGAGVLKPHLRREAKPGFRGPVDCGNSVYLAATEELDV